MYALKTRSAERALVEPLPVKDGAAASGQAAAAERFELTTAPGYALHGDPFLWPPDACGAGTRWLVLEVQDSGCGIAAEDLPRIWDRLFRADRSRHHRGLGLGLSLVRAIVRTHGGRVEVESAPGRGSCFRIWLAEAGPATRDT